MSRFASVVYDEIAEQCNKKHSTELEKLICIHNELIAYELKLVEY